MQHTTRGTEPEPAPAPRFLWVNTAEQGSPTSTLHQHQLGPRNLWENLALLVISEQSLTPAPWLPAGNSQDSSPSCDSSNNFSTFFHHIFLEQEHFVSISISSPSPPFLCTNFPFQNKHILTEVCSTPSYTPDFPFIWESGKSRLLIHFTTLNLIPTRATLFILL